MKCPLQTRSLSKFALPDAGILRITLREVWPMINAVRVSQFYLMSIPLLTKLRSSSL